MIIAVYCSDINVLFCLCFNLVIMVYCCCDFGLLCLSWFTTMGFIVYFDDYGVTWQLQFTVLILVFCGDYDVLWW